MKVLHFHTHKQGNAFSYSNNTTAHVYVKIHERTCSGANTAQLIAVFALRHPLSTVFFTHTNVGSALSVVLHFLVILLRENILNISTFGELSICRTNW